MEPVRASGPFRGRDGPSAGGHGHVEKRSLGGQAAGLERHTKRIDHPLCTGSAAAWKTTADPFVGKITYFRVYSGTVHSDSRVWNQGAEVEERFGGVSVMRGKDQLGVKSVHAGDIASIPKLSATSTGHTFCDKGHPLTLAIPEYPSALYRVAISPKTQADSAKLSPTLTRLCEEDMTLSWEQVPATKQTI